MTTLNKNLHMGQMKMSKKFDIIVLDNAIPEALADQVEQTLTSRNFPWYLMNDVDKDQLKNMENYRVHLDGNAVPTVQLGHGVFDSQLNNPFIEDKEVRTIDMAEIVLNTAVEFACGHATPLKDRTHEYEPLFVVEKLRIKYNMLFPNYITEGKNNVPHVDNNFTNSYSAIYFVNDSDGDTVIFNEKYTKDTKARPECALTVKRRVTPKKNRFVLFDGQYYHASTNPRDSEKRIVINYNMINIAEEPGGHLYKEDK